MTTASHYVANIHSTVEALKWIFEAKEGEVSPLYECGDNNHLLVVVLNKIHRIGYRDLSDPDVKEMVKAEVIKDKKAEQLMAKVNGVKSIAAAKAKGGKISSVNQITSLLLHSLQQLVLASLLFLVLFLQQRRVLSLHMLLRVMLVFTSSRLLTSLTVLLSSMRDIRAEVSSEVYAVCW